MRTVGCTRNARYWTDARTLFQDAARDWSGHQPGAICARLRRRELVVSDHDVAGGGLYGRCEVELEELLAAMDRTAANLAKLEAVWERASPLVPRGPSRGSSPDYHDLQRAWTDLRAGLPLIDGWTITNDLPDIDELGQTYLEYAEIGEAPTSADKEAEQPGTDLAEYRFRLNRARRRAARDRLRELIMLVDSTLPLVVEDVAADSQAYVDKPQVAQVSAAIGEIERLLGDASGRQGRWSDLRRHLRFGLGVDWHDIQVHDWPSVRRDIEAAVHADTDPLPVPDIDLGRAAVSPLSGRATIALQWSRLDDGGFERLLYDLLRDIPEHVNVQWLMATRAPDRGRDISLDRILRDSIGGARTERVIVQAKHWLSRSLRATDVGNAMTAVKLWPAPVRGLIIATTGRFSADAVAWAEQHNEGAAVPFIDLWPDTRLESLLAERPHLAAAHGLR